MRRRSVFGVLSLAVTGVVLACSGSNNGESGFGGGDGGTGKGASSSGTGASSSGTLSDGSGQNIGLNEDGGGNNQPGVDGGEIVKTTIYAHTCNELYSMDPATKQVTDIGPLTGINDAGPGYDDQCVTDLAVNAAGDVYVNTEDYLYQVQLPAASATPVPVPITKIAAIVTPGGSPGLLSDGTTAQRFVALAFAPPGLLGSGETLVGGDTNGEVWSIDPTSGAAKDLGNFGADPNVSGNFLALSGDIVFYTDSSNHPTGIATIRSCAPPTKAGYSPSCVKNNDYLAGINIAALTNAYTTGTPANTANGGSLNGGMYGGTSIDGGVGTTGPGVQFGEVFGLGAWGGNVYGFTNYQAGKDAGAATLPSFITIDTASGAGTLVNDSYTFTNGWAGAGVTTKVTVTILPPPPPPPPK